MISQTTLLAFLVILFFSSIVNISESREFQVGGSKKSWKVPSSPDEFNKWAEKIRFEIGDSIVLKYDSKTDSVLQVTEENYKNCNKSNPIKSYNDGKSKITFDDSGPFFFISGAEGHCEKGQKLEIKVLSAKHAHQKTAPAPSPVVIDHIAPAPAPSTGGTVLRPGWFMVFVVVVGILSMV